MDDHAAPSATLSCLPATAAACAADDLVRHLEDLAAALTARRWLVQLCGATTDGEPATLLVRAAVSAPRLFRLVVTGPHCLQVLQERAGGWREVGAAVDVEDVVALLLGRSLSTGPVAARAVVAVAGGGTGGTW